MRATIAAAAVLVALALSPAIASADLLTTIEHPTRVPAFSFISLGLGIEPGSTGTYGFSLTNRYNASLDNISITVEIYRYATVEEERNFSDLPQRPSFAAGGGAVARLDLPTIAPNTSAPFRLSINAPQDALEGVYFTRHTLEFDYGNVTEPPAPAPYTAHFVMKSRGHFTDAEWDSLNYSDLSDSLAALNISGVIPDSSFSVRAPSPVWPLATLIVLTAGSGTLALLYSLVDQRPRKYPRVERALLRLEGKVTVWKTLARARVRRRQAAGEKPPKAQ